MGVSWIVWPTRVAGEPKTHKVTKSQSLRPRKHIVFLHLASCGGKSSQEERGSWIALWALQMITLP